MSTVSEFHSAVAAVRLANASCRALAKSANPRRRLEVEIEFNHAAKRAMDALEKELTSLEALGRKSADRIAATAALAKRL